MMNTITQTILGLLGLSGDADGWPIELRALVVDLLTVKQELDSAKQKHEARMAILGPHQKRIAECRGLGASLIQHFASTREPEAVMNIETLRVQQVGCDEALTEIEKRMKTTGEPLEQLSVRFEDLSNQLIDLLQLPIPEPSISDNTNLLDDDVISPEVLDDVMSTYKDWAGILTSGQGRGCTPEDFERAEEIAADREREELKDRYVQLKLEKRSLEEASNAHELTDGIDHLQQQILEVCDELMMRNIPCRNGSIIAEYDDDDGDDDEGYNDYHDRWPQDAYYLPQDSDESLRSNCNADVQMVDCVGNLCNCKSAGPSQPAIPTEAEPPKPTGEQPGLFANAGSCIEPPTDRRNFEDERWISAVEHEQRLRKTTQQVEKWQAAFSTHAEDLSVDEKRSHDAMSQLHDLVVGENWSMNSLRRDMETEERYERLVDVWERRCDKIYSNLDADTKAAHPRTMAA